MFKYGAAADEAYSGDEALDNFGRSIGRIHQKRFGRLNKSAACQGDERKRAETGAASFFLAIPSYRQRQRIGAGEGDKMRNDLKSVQGKVT